MLRTGQKTVKEFWLNSINKIIHLLARKS